MSEMSDPKRFGFCMLGCCIPIVGIVLFIVLRNSEQKEVAKMAGIGVLFSIVFFVIYMGLGAFALLLA